MKNNTHIIGLLEERISFNDPRDYVGKTSINKHINDSIWIPYELLDTLTFKEIRDVYTDEDLKCMCLMFLMPMDRENKDFIIKRPILRLGINIEDENMMFDQYFFKYLCENLHKTKEDDLIYIAHFLEKYICSYEDVLEIFRASGISEEHEVFQKRHNIKTYSLKKDR